VTSSELPSQRYQVAAPEVLLAQQFPCDNNDDENTTTPTERGPLAVIFDIITKNRLKSGRVLRTQQYRRSVWTFRILLVLADILLYLMLDDTSTALQQKIEPLPGAQVLPVNHHNMMRRGHYQLSHAEAWESPEFKVGAMDPLILPETDTFHAKTESWHRSNLFWVWGFLLVGVVAEWLWSNITLRRVATALQSRDL